MLNCQREELDGAIDALSHGMYRKHVAQSTRVVSCEFGFLSSLCKEPIGGSVFLQLLNFILSIQSPVI
ncbi:hypothetical protein DUNSADRAFT_1170 [Dunaliella salina]|uniref:Uncharacterized protein n=1 Tax=Dunaliella salina TaxID=3046 RepID=A0ABQ7GXH2_DUNSA|nr:hypothetical protein DUNSADRAFT_1170 [Dunaliella salina]|eukprot:KAF5839297.1 hypothetical protein DUNSADRAFT_1170 [Dunaliella salina]